MDTLDYAKRLRERGIPQDEAEAHAEAVRDFVMVELVTKTDLQTAISLVEAKIDAQTLTLTVAAEQGGGDLRVVEDIVGSRDQDRPVLDFKRSVQLNKGAGPVTS
jgi:hypothetical protein